jgi:hypothetical protein
VATNGLSLLIIGVVVVDCVIVEVLQVLAIDPKEDAFDGFPIDVLLDRLEFV